MLTILRRRVSRVTKAAYHILYPQYEERPIVVSLVDGDLIEFREKGRSARFQLPIEEAFLAAVRKKALRAAIERKRRRA